MPFGHTADLRLAHNMFSYNQPKLVEGLQLVFDTVANTMVESVLHEPLRIDA
jgi:hypothetical protein